MQRKTGFELRPLAERDGLYRDVTAYQTSTLDLKDEQGDLEMSLSPRDLIAKAGN
ncbi:hypothetical protein PROP_00999 [Propionicimonas sp. T2.31MG-18]|jgi:hypothetical protein